MSNKNIVARNYIYNLLYQLLTLITPFITAPYTARIFQAAGIGIESYVSSVTYYFSLFGALGISVYGQREIARTRSDAVRMSRTFWELFLIKLISTGLSFLVYTIVILNVKENQIYFWVSSATLIAGIFDVSWFLMGVENFRVLVLRNTIIKILSIIILFVFIKDGSQLLFYMCLSLITTFMANLSLWSFVLRQLVRIDVYTLNIKRHLKETLVYFIPTIATSVYTVLDKVMLGILTSGTIENGYYEQANKIVNMAKTVLLSLNTVMLPRLSCLYAEGKNAEVKNSVLQSLKFVMLIGIPLSFGLSAISGNFISWFLGSGFQGTVLCLKIMSWLVVIIGISNCLENQYITPIGKKRESNKIVIIGAIINFVLNMVFIPRFGSSGAAFASVIAEIIISVMYINLCKQIVTIGILVKIAYRNVIAAFAMLFVISVLNRVIMNAILLTILQFLIGAIVYFIVLLLLRDEVVIDYGKKILERVKH